MLLLTQLNLFSSLCELDRRASARLPVFLTNRCSRGSATRGGWNIKCWTCIIPPACQAPCRSVVYLCLLLAWSPQSTTISVPTSSTTTSTTATAPAARARTHTPAHTRAEEDRGMGGGHQARQTRDGGGRGGMMVSDRVGENEEERKKGESLWGEAGVW